jgi:hypothetical protein
VAFQVGSGSNPTYLDFNDDVREMMVGTAKMIFNCNTCVKLERENTQNTYRLNINSGKNSIENDLMMFGRFSFASGNTPMSTSILSENIKQSAKDFLDYTEKTIGLLNSLLLGGNTENFNESMLEFLKSTMDLDEETINALKEQREFSFIGYTSTQFYGNSEACYSPVVFLSQGELESLYKIFKNFKIEQLSATEKRAQFKQLVLNQTMSLIGEKNPETIENMSLDEIWQAILGIPFDTKNKYQGLSKVKIRELDKKGNESKMDNFLLLFQNSINYFKLTTFENYKFEGPADSYYWIPLSKFPGNE